MHYFDSATLFLEYEPKYLANELSKPAISKNNMLRTISG
jgi:hypothetical protein